MYYSKLHLVCTFIFDILYNSFSKYIIKKNKQQKSYKDIMIRLLDWREYSLTQLQN